MTQVTQNPSSSTSTAATDSVADALHAANKKRQDDELKRLEEDMDRHDKAVMEAERKAREDEALAAAEKALRRGKVRMPSTAAMKHISTAHPDLLKMDGEELAQHVLIAKVAKSREDAEISRIKRELAQGSVVKTKEVKTKMQEQAAAIIAILTQGIWSDMRDVTDALDTETRAKFKASHDKAITALRGRIADAISNAPKFKTRKEKNGHQ